MVATDAERSKKYRDNKAQNDADAAWAAEFDADGKRYKGEARPLSRLLRIYHGQPEVEDNEEDELLKAENKKREKKGQTKDKLPNPSATALRIRDSRLEPEVRAKGRKRSVLSSQNVVYEVDEKVTFPRWLELRDRARKDLFWLCRLLGLGVFHNVHQITCDQFVQKNFGGPWLKLDGTPISDNEREPIEVMYYKGYTLDDFHDMIDRQVRVDEKGEETKEMMLLDSRGFYKSTIDGADSVQWLLCCPDIRILIITGEYKLAESFLKEIKEYFFLAPGQDPKPLHLLFPEYVLTGVDGTSKEPLHCPARLLAQRQPSVWVNAIVANLSGWHCDIKKGDDVVTDENSNTEDAREKLKKKYDGTDDLLDAHGFNEHLGTRYFTSDWYGTRLAPDSDTKQIAVIRYHKRGCWVVKTEYQDVPLMKLEEYMVDLTFPQVWSFKKLRQRLLKKGEKEFKNQQLNEPSDDDGEDTGFRISFTEELLRAHMYQRSAAPMVGDVFIAWDWALSDKKTSDYSCGVAARITQDTRGNFGIVVLEIIYGKWKSSELAFQIVAFNRKHNAKRTLIEASNGCDLLREEIKRVAFKYQVSIDNIYWKPVSTADNAKRNRIKGLEILLNDDRLHFVMGPWIDETFAQLCRYTGEKKNKGRKDDIPDALAYLCYFLPANAIQVMGADPEEIRKLAQEEREKALKQMQYDRYFGQNMKPTLPPPVLETSPRPRDQRQALLGRIFGNNGLRA